MRNIVMAFALAATPLTAQWINHPTPGIPRTEDGKANLSAPAPRTRDGKPDSGHMVGSRFQHEISGEPGSRWS